MNRSFFLFARHNLLSGMARILDFGGTINDYNISPSGEIADQRALYEDWKAIGDDMRAVLASYRKEQETRRYGEAE